MWIIFYVDEIVLYPGFNWGGILVIVNGQFFSPHENLFLLANAKINGGVSHAWVKFKNIHIDITADQFTGLNKPKVIVSYKNPWPAVSYTAHRFSDERFDKGWYEKLLCSYEHIKYNQNILNNK